MITTEPNWLVYLCPPDIFEYTHELSTGTGPASISDSPSGLTWKPDVARIRIVLGDTNWIEKGNVGEAAYSVDGNSFALTGTKAAIILSNAWRVEYSYLL